MNRFSFRAWDHDNNCWYKSTQLVIRPSGKVSDGGIVPNVEIMQCTGEKDKKGKEIYEDDILKGEYNDWIVVFEKGCFQASQINCVSHLVPFCNVLNEIIEVIGNIHENPELLKEV